MTCATCSAVEGKVLVALQAVRSAHDRIASTASDRELKSARRALESAMRALRKRSRS